MVASDSRAFDVSRTLLNLPRQVIPRRWLKSICNFLFLHETLNMYLPSTTGICLFLIGLTALGAQAPAQDADTRVRIEGTWDQGKGGFQKRGLACHRGERGRGGVDVERVGGSKGG